MTTKLEFTFNNEKELADFMAKLQTAVNPPSAHVSKEPLSKATTTTIPAAAPASSSPSPVKPLEVVDDTADFTAFRQSVTTLLAKNPKGKEVFKQLLTKKGYGKLSDVPVAERQHFTHDLVWELNDDPDLPF